MQLPPPPPPVKRGQKPPPAPPEKVLNAHFISTQEAWEAASDSEAAVELDSDSLNPHFAYDDVGGNVRHQIWFLDAVTVDNQIRAARAMGLQTFALWRLGSEDNSLWKIWDAPLGTDPVKALTDVPPGYDIDTEGDGDILRVTRKPQNGTRQLKLDDDDTVKPQYRSITSEVMPTYPLSYTVELYGYQPKKVAITFDDGPDPYWTPKILDVLKRFDVKATFFMIGEIAGNNVGLMQRVYREGHEIGNHTFTHPDISEISASPGRPPTQPHRTSLRLETRRPAPLLPPSLLHRPGPRYQRPGRPRGPRPGPRLRDRRQQNRHQRLGRAPPQDPRRDLPVRASTRSDQMDKQPWMRGSVILMHDGGGDRSATIAALPVLIQTLREHGYQIVPVSELVGKTRAEVMPRPQPHQQRWQARVDSTAFFFYAVL